MIADRTHDAGQRLIEPLRKVQRDYDWHLYKARRLIEKFFARPKQYRAIASRYDKTICAFLGSIHLAAILVWLV